MRITHQARPAMITIDIGIIVLAIFHNIVLPINSQTTAMFCRNSSPEFTRGNSQEGASFPRKSHRGFPTQTESAY